MAVVGLVATHIAEKDGRRERNAERCAALNTAADAITVRAEAWRRRGELVEAVNAWLFADTRREVRPDETHIGKLERGEHPRCAQSSAR